MLLSAVSQLPTPAIKIISLVPSQTELLHSLGLEEEVIGITKFCIHPTEWFRNKIRVGGTKTIDIERIKSLHPDLIIANKEENVAEQIEQLAESFPVWVSDVHTLEDAYIMIVDIGQLTNRIDGSVQLINQVKKEFDSLGQPAEKIPVAYLIWKDPWMTVGGDTFINDLLRRAGYDNVFADRLRYPELSIGEIRDSNCTVLFLSSEPYPFKEKHIAELQAALPRVKIQLVDGEIFSWYGSRLLLAPAYFSQLRHQLLT